MKKIWLPFILVFLINALYRGFRQLGIFAWHPWLLAFFGLVCSFCLGLALNQQRRRHRGWVFKLVVSFTMLFIFFIQVGLLPFGLWWGFDYPLGYFLFYLVCGYSFFLA